jgi:1-pyrroline-5-carboxylate dehydrogenase
MMTPAEFRNEPLVDFTSEAGRGAMQDALRSVEGELGREFPLLIGGKAVRTEKTFRSLNPSRSDQTVAVLHQAGPPEVDAAVAAALGAYESWRWVPAEERAELMLRAAAILRRRRRG